MDFSCPVFPDLSEYHMEQECTGVRNESVKENILYVMDKKQRNYPKRLNMCDKWVLFTF